MKQQTPMTDNKPPIINCHTHIFTGDHVPPYLGKSIIASPLYKLVNFQWVFARFRWWFEKGPGKKKYGGAANAKRARQYRRRMRIQRNSLLRIVFAVVGWYLTFQAIDILLHWLFGGSQKTPGWIKGLHAFLTQYHILLDVRYILLQLLVILVVIVFFKSGRNLLLFIAKNTISLLKKIPGKETKELFERYLTIGRFAFHRTQQGTLNQLKDQYPEGSGFVILPMDMEYMEAGKPTESYPDQMQKLADLKDNGQPIYPFVFVDPRRIAADPDYFRYDYVNGHVVLLDCFIKKYIEEKEFSGFKIYPALGYYPFDPLLLPLWKYAEQKQLPILTHCVRGPMYFRGVKKKEWDTHPVFKQTSEGGGVNDPLLLPETKNDAFSSNFTHPLNFVCLLKKKYLAMVVHNACRKDPERHQKLQQIFGLTENELGDGRIEPEISIGLDDLKICLGHYGGNDEWLRHFESDRYNHNNELSQTPDRGIEFVYLKNTTTFSPGKPEQLWKDADWYSIISSLMLQHKHVYADISYILHNHAQTLPLLKQTLQNPWLRKKVLYGTDFYVVRNHKSDKHMLADMMGGLDEKDFDQIARCNPRAFLNLPSLP
jgi:hypothetical protein